MNTNITEQEYKGKMDELYAAKDYAACLELFKDFYKQYPGNMALNFKCCWSLYHKELKVYNGDQYSLERFKQQVNFIIDHVEDKGNMLVWCAVKKLLEVVDDQVKIGRLKAEAALVLKNTYLDRVDYQGLSGEEWENKAAGRMMASPREEWFSQKTKILQKANRWQELIDYCDQALQLVPRCHNNNDSWFSYRKAIAKYQLQELEEAAQLVEEIFKTGFKHWCFNQLLFNIYLASNKEDQAIRQLCLAALADKHHEMRVGLYDEYVQLLLRQGELEMAVLHRQLVTLLRQENNWTEKKYADQLEISADILALSKKEVMERLTSFWKENITKGQEVLTGTIARIIVENKNGFIKGDASGVNYYFSSRDFLTRAKEFKVGQRVSFVLEERFDKKQQENKENAVQISLL